MGTITVQFGEDAYGEITGTGQVAEMVFRELSHCGSQESCPSGRRIWQLEMTDEPPPVVDVSFGNVGDAGQFAVFRFERMDMDLAVRVREHDPLNARLHLGRRGPPYKLGNQTYRLFERTAMTWEQARAYHVVALTEALCLYSQHVGVIHASAVERNGTATLLVSAGGVGKTSTACRLVRDYGFRHLADDIAIVRPTGEVSRSLRKLMLYPYNVKDQPDLAEALVENDTRVGRLLWRLDEILSLNRRRRRVSARELFGESAVAERGTIGSALLLRRWAGDGVRFSPIDDSGIVKRANAIVELEFSLYLDPLRLWSALVGELGPLNERDVLRSNEAVLARAFDGASVAALDVGFNQDAAAAVAEFVGRGT